MVFLTKKKDAWEQRRESVVQNQVPRFLGVISFQPSANNWLYGVVRRLPEKQNIKIRY